VALLADEIDLAARDRAALRANERCSPCADRSDRRTVDVPRVLLLLQIEPGLELAVTLRERCVLQVLRVPKSLTASVPENLAGPR
jgi:hypothetical protein